MALQFMFYALQFFQWRMTEFRPETLPIIWIQLFQWSKWSKRVNIKNKLVNAIPTITISTSNCSCFLINQLASSIHVSESLGIHLWLLV